MAEFVVAKKVARDEGFAQYGEMAMESSRLEFCFPVMIRVGAVLRHFFSQSERFW